MTDWKLRLYHGLPAPLQSLAASWRGRQLRRWRYGEDLERLVGEALAREHWTAEQWSDWQEDRLARLLHRAATRVPFYREQWAERRRKGDRASWEVLEHWPLLEKDALRRTPSAFLADDCDPRAMFHDHTSGTMGKSIDLWLTRETVRAWYALAEARWRRWYGVSIEDCWGILGGQLIAPVARTRPPFWVWNGPMKQLYLSAYHLSPELIPHYVDALRKYQPRYLLGYTSSLHTLARHTLDLGGSPLPLQVVITNAEPVHEYQRETIAAAFQCPVRETYGMAETVAAASECEAGRLHVWPEAGRLELHAGELISTGLLNAEMPLIRYRTGDSVQLAETSIPCECGRSLPRLASIEGRLDDVIYTPDGRRVGRLDPVFKSRLPVREAQILQERLDTLRVRYVPEAGFDAAAAESIRHRLRERVGPMHIDLEPVDQIERGPNGKFRAVLCRLPPELLAQLADRGAKTPASSDVVVDSGREDKGL